MIEPPVVRIPAPMATPEPPRPGFPVVATLAPLAMAGVLFAVTGSPFMLLMAVLSPVIAAGTLIDARRQRRRARREEAARLAAEIDATGTRIAAAQRAERDRLAGFASLAPQWSRAADAPLLVAVGRGDVASGIEVGTALDARADTPELERLRSDAATLAAAPVVRDLGRGAVVQGPHVLAAAVARSLVLRLLARASPAVASLVAPADESWARGLPHLVDDGPEGGYLVRLGDREIPIAWTRPPGDDAVRVDAADGDAVTRASAAREAGLLAAAAQAAGLRPPGAELPDLVRLAQILDAAAGPGLSAPVGVDADGIVRLDLVADGPHAVVAGTTGSGKSELLVSWVLGMAAGRGPDEVAFVLVDFKGGAAFAPLAGLPHVLGTLSDLDERLARRAIESLRAEVLRRERVLASAGARAIADLPPGALARLVVVVDEFAALVAERPELHALFADLAARGRSLGIHLVLCTQRPAGVVRDAVLANVAVRIALRVADRTDSLGLIGDDAAARLPPGARGRAVLIDGVRPPRQVQLALADPADAARVGAVPRTATVPRPWCDPLPERVPHRDLPAAAGIAFGLLDLPAEQRQPVAALEPRHGHLLILGAAGSGVTTALEAIAAGAGGDARWLPADPVDLWGAVDPERIGPGAVLLADDLDLTLSRCDAEHAPDLADLVARLLREAPQRGIRVVAGARRLAGPLVGLAPHFGSRLLLRLASREEHVLAGGEGARFDPRAVPGAGSWDGAVVQVALPEPGARHELAGAPLPLAGEHDRELAVVSGRPREVAALVGDAGVRLRWVGVPDDGLVVANERSVILGDPDAWQADWAALSRARRELPIAFHACAPADVRAVVRSREALPPLRPGEVWLARHGRVVRARLGVA